MTNNVVVNLDRFISKPISDKEFFTLGLDMAGTFDSKEEFGRFLIAIGSSYPEGVPFEYFWQRIESYRKTKLMDLMTKAGFIEYVDNDGNFFYQKVVGKGIGVVTR